MIELRRIRMFTKIFELAVAHPALSHYPAFAAETEYQGIPTGSVPRPAHIQAHNKPKALLPLLGDI